MQSHPTPVADWLVVLPVLLPLAGGALLLVLRRWIAAQRWIALFVILAVLAAEVGLAFRVLREGPIAMTMGRWLPPFGISFVADGAGAGFAVLAALVALAVWASLQADTPTSAVRDGVYPLLLLLLVGVSGAVLTGDLFNLYVWFEVMLIASFGLVALAGGPLQLDGALKYGIANLLATTILLAGLGLFYGLVGTLNMADIVTTARRVDVATLSAVSAVLALAFAVKAALLPVGSWLPASYHTPPPAISSLVGALLTKVGVLALLRLLLMLVPQADGLKPVLAVLAVITMLFGPLSAIVEGNLRRAIGFLLIGGVGVSLACLAGPDVLSTSGALAYVFHAVLTIGALYLVAGMIERATGTAAIEGMGGLYAANSTLSILFFVLVLAIAGIPPFLGFWPKLLLLQSFIAAGNWWVVFALLGNSLLTLIAGIRLWSRIFWRPSTVSLQPASGSSGAILLVGTVILVSFMPGLLIEMARDGAQTMLNPSSYIAAVGIAP